MELSKPLSPPTLKPMAVSGASWFVCREHASEAETSAGTRRKLNEKQEKDWDVNSAPSRVGHSLRANWVAHKLLVERLAALMCASQVRSHVPNTKCRLESPGFTELPGTIVGRARASTWSRFIGPDAGNRASALISPETSPILLGRYHCSRMSCRCSNG